MTLSGRNVTHAEINKIFGAKYVQNENPRKV